MKKPTRSLSGVLPVAVVSKPIGCKHKCLYCPSLDVPKSYTPDSPAILRAKALGYDAYKQVRARLKVLKAMKHSTNKIELIIIGGTFLEMPLEYQKHFVKQCYDALNGFHSRSLEEAKKINEKAKNRVVGFCIETRPDVCGKAEILNALDYGVTRIELGVQAIDDKILEAVNRGHGVKEIINATALLKDSGFKVGYHFMPGLPGSSIKKDIQMYKKLFSDERFRPDQIKIYPVQVIKGSELEKLYNESKYMPYSKEELIELLIKLKLLTPRYCRIMRLMREVPKQWLVAGVISINLRQELSEIMKARGLRCSCIRCREIGFRERELKEREEAQDRKEKNGEKEKVEKCEFKIKITRYNASKGKEFFIEAINEDDSLLGLLRLRFPYKPFISELEDRAIVRELHVYGRALKIGEIKADASQHRGIGKSLLEIAESIAKQSYDGIAIISGVGVREYYRKLGYMLVGHYMIKSL